MAPIISATAGLKRPSEIAIAFAIAIVRSKPQELTVREYLQHLRSHISKGRRVGAISSSFRHLDRSSYWHSEYERLETALKASEAETIDCKLEVDRLKAQLDTTTATNTKKRKKVDEDVVPVLRLPKKSKRDASPSRRTNPGSESSSDFDFTRIGEVGNILMRSLYQIHAILKSTQRTDPPVLAHHLVRAAASVSQVIHQSLQRVQTLADQDLDFFQAVVTASGRSMSSLLAGFTRLSNVTNGAEVQGHVIYAFVQMYSKLITVLDEASISEVRTAHKAESSLLSEKKRPATSKGQQAKPAQVKDNKVVHELATLFINAIESLDPKIEAHRSLFEGLTYVVLESLGSKLYTTVVGHARGATMEAEILSSHVTDDIEEVTEPSSMTPEELQLRVAKLEAPYLIHLLSRIMNAAPVHLGGLTGSKNSKPKQASGKGLTKGALAITAKERLQRTLVNCIFGTEGVDEDDPFKDCLKMPTMAKSTVPMPKVKEAEVQDWFKEEVWRLLGWEILAKEGDN